MFETCRKCNGKGRVVVPKMRPPKLTWEDAAIEEILCPYCLGAGKILIKEMPYEGSETHQQIEQRASNAEDERDKMRILASIATAERNMYKNEHEFLRQRKEELERELYLASAEYFNDHNHLGIPNDHWYHIANKLLKSSTIQVLRQG